MLASTSLARFVINWHSRNMSTLTINLATLCSMTCQSGLMIWLQKIPYQTLVLHWYHLCNERTFCVHLAGLRPPLSVGQRPTFAPALLCSRQNIQKDLRDAPVTWRTSAQGHSVARVRLCMSGEVSLRSAEERWPSGLRR